MYSLWKGFSVAKSALYLHMKVHNTSDKQFQCEQCESKIHAETEFKISHSTGSWSSTEVRTLWCVNQRTHFNAQTSAGDAWRENEVQLRHL